MPIQYQSTHRDDRGDLRLAARAALLRPALITIGGGALAILVGAGAPMTPATPGKAAKASLQEVEAGRAKKVALSDAADVQVADAEGGYASTHVLVRLKPGVRPAKLVDGRWALVGAASAGGARERATAKSAAILTSANAKGATTVFGGLSDQVLATQLGLNRTYRIDVPGGTDTPKLVRELAAITSLVELAELDGIGGLADAPNDPNFAQQYAMNNTGQTIGGVPGLVDADLDGPEAWTLAASLNLDTSTVTIGLLDAGVNQHVELTGRILPGFNVPDGTTITTDECSSHGTHVTGIMAAAGNNGVGIAGLAWQAKIKPYVVVNGCNGFESSVATGLTMATDAGLRLVNMSLQYYTGTSTLLAAVQYAALHDVIMVAAAGNNGNSNVAYPGKWPETIAVAATTNLDQKWSSSNFGPEIDVAAPGLSVHSLIGTTSYGEKNGTSMAAPQVTGIIALMLARNPTLTTAQVRAILQSTTNDIDAPGFDNNTGFGRVNAFAALSATPSPLPADLDGDGDVGPMDLAILLGAWGPCGSCDGACAADLDGNCSVGPEDLGILLGSWST